MVLRVESAEFVAECAARLPSERTVYLEARGRRTVASMADVASGLLIQSVFPARWEQAASQLRDAGLEVRTGGWSDTLDEPDEDERLPFVCAIAYRSEESKPGLWLDADVMDRNPAEFLRRMYDEFVANGEIRETTFDEFARVLSANVVILPPHQIEAFAERNRT